MKPSLFIPIFTLVLVAGCTTTPQPDARGRAILQAPDRPVALVRQWHGAFSRPQDEALIHEAPASGYIAHPEAWAKLWKTWRGQQALPNVDFDKQLVMVGTTACAVNSISPRFTLDPNGDLKNCTSHTLVCGPGFAYSIVVIHRAHVKTYRGQRITKD